MTSPCISLWDARIKTAGQLEFEMIASGKKVEPPKVLSDGGIVGILLDIR